MGIICKKKENLLFEQSRKYFREQLKPTFLINQRFILKKILEPFPDQESKM